jgi:hypothetical protein
MRRRCDVTNNVHPTQDGASVLKTACEGKEKFVMVDMPDTKTTKRPLVWTHDDDPEALAEDIVDTLQTAQHVLILVEDGSLITGNARDGFATLEGDEIPEQALLGLGVTMRVNSHRRIVD